MITREQLDARRQRYLADEAEIRRRLDQARQEQANMAEALQRTVGARLDVEHWLDLIQQQQQQPEGPEYDLASLRVIE